MRLKWVRVDNNAFECHLIDLYMSVYKDEGKWEFSVTQLAGDGGGAIDDSAETFGSSFGALNAADLWFENRQREELTDRYLGWFDNPNESEPAFNPDYGYCPYCTETFWHDPIITISLMVEADDRSYFYRAHKQCYHKDEARVNEFEAIFIDLIESRMKATP